MTSVINRIEIWLGWCPNHPKSAPSKMDYKIYIIAAICALVILAAVPRIFSPGVSPAGDMNGRVIGCNATPAQVEKINELWGKNISIGEYDEQICPQYLVDMPPDLKEVLYKNRWQWGPGPSNTTTENTSPEVMNVTTVPEL